MFQVNFNDYVKVRLTDYGVSILKRQRTELNKQIKENGGKGFGEYEPKTDEQGYTAFQIWDLMERLGPYMGLWKQTPIEGTMIFMIGEQTGESSGWRMAKQKLMTYYCLDKSCGYSEQSHKVRDGLRCPECGGPTGVRPATPPPKSL